MPLATATITSNGAKLPEEYGLVSIDVCREANRIPRAELVLIDGDAAQRKFAISDGAFFAPGNPVEIALRYEGEPSSAATVFKGVVTGQAIEATSNQALLTVELRDVAVKLTKLVHHQVFARQSDDALIKSLAQAAGLAVGTLAKTSAVHEEIIQYGCTDWDFIVARAEANGLLVGVTDGRLSAQTINVDASPKHTFEYGIHAIYAFDIEADANSQYGEVQSLAWSVKDLAMSPAAKASEAKVAPGNLDGKKLAGGLGAAAQTLTSPAPLLPDEAKAWANAALLRSRLGLVRGRISLPGLGGIGLFDVIELKSMGARFSGKALVTGIRHRLTEQGWLTDLQFGLAPEWFCDRPGVSARPAAGLLPAVGGLQIGIVAGFADDPERQFRLKVNLPALGGDQPPVWARLASPDAGAERGFFFRPEAGDEVVVGFINGDPRQALVLGALYSAKNPPPGALGPPTAENYRRGLVTKKGTQIGFDDEKGTVCIQSANQNTILVDDEAKTIRIADQHGNTITLDQHGISIKSAKDLTLEASGKVAIKGSQVDVQ